MRRLALFAALSLSAALPARAAPPAAAGLPPALAAEIDRTVQEGLAATGAPSASIAVVKDGRIAYLKAYGSARLGPDIPATVETRYGVGSVSKEFTAAAILLLAEKGKLSLEDPVGKYVPGLTAGDRITIRQILSHTSGYRDYWPQDYVPPAMLAPIAPDAILTQWARTPLDFEPQTQWQYSNTGYTIAGLIVETVSGEPLMRFLQERIFAPLRMGRVTEVDSGPLPAPDSLGYTRAGLGPFRPAPKEGKGWLFAMGALAMTPRDLALWDISVIDRSLLKPASYAEQLRPVMLRNGQDSLYGLGFHIETTNGRLMVEHGGEISGTLSENRIYPNDRTAVVVLANSDSGSPQDEIADRIAFLVLDPSPADRAARAVFADLQAGRIDAALLTENARSYFTPQALADLAASLGPLGPPRLFKLQRERQRGGMTLRAYTVLCARGKVSLVERVMPDGKIEQYLVGPAAS